MLRGVQWGPTQQTMIVLHHCYIESRIRYGMPAWYPFLAQKFKNKLEKYLCSSIRNAIGLPIHCWNEALMVEADLDTLHDMFLKCVVSLYARINPTGDSHSTLVKKYFWKREPTWASYLKRIPESIWGGPIQVKLSKKVILTPDTVTVKDQTIENQHEADVIENKFHRILYTDAYVNQASNPPGKSAIGYIWYYKDLESLWKQVTRGSAIIGDGHSSYSAEAIAIIEG